MAPEPKPKSPEGINKTLADLSSLRGDMSANAYNFFGGIGAGLGNFAESLGNYFSGKAQAAPGQGIGDRSFAAEQARVYANLGKTLPLATPVITAADDAILRGGAAQIRNPQSAPGYTPAAGGGAGAPAPGAATPANVNIPPRLGARAQEEAMANRYGLAYTPGQAAGTAAQQYADQQLRQQVESTYANTSKALADQIAAAQDRYGANQADLKNIFGTLTTIRSADKAKINQQFTNSIQAAQDQQAARTAQAQAQLKLGQQGAATAGAELGAGPTQMPTDSLTSQAVAQGIADSNANQATWGNLMGAMNMQQQGNVDTSVQGYNLQQAAALDQLRRDYEDRLLGMQGQQASLQDQISQAIMGVKGAQAQAQGDLALQELKNQGLADVANIRARASLAKGSSSPKAPSYSKDIYGFQQRVNDAFGADGFNNLVGTVDAARQLATQRKVAAAQAAGTTAKAPSTTEIMSAWKAVSGMPQLLPYVTEYVNKY